MNRLMRNERDGKGKYSVINNRTGKLIDDDGPGGRNEHFVVMLKDKHARAALMAYSQSALGDGHTAYAEDVMELANRAGPCHPNCKEPD